MRGRADDRTSRSARLAATNSWRPEWTAATAAPDLSRMSSVPIDKGRGTPGADRRRGRAGRGSGTGAPAGRSGSAVAAVPVLIVDPGAVVRVVLVATRLTLGSHTMRLAIAQDCATPFASPLRFELATDKDAGARVWFMHPAFCCLPFQGRARTGREAHRFRGASRAASPTPRFLWTVRPAHRRPRCEWTQPRQVAIGSRWNARSMTLVATSGSTGLNQTPVILASSIGGRYSRASMAAASRSRLR